MAIPVMRVWCAALAVLLLVGHSEARNITNEDIRDAMLSLVHMFRTSEDKLERHEYREKALGEQLKKMMVGLEKKHRALEPLKGMISRLDERLYNVENIFLQKEEKEKVSQKKTNDVLADIQKSLQTLTDIVTKLPTNIVKRLDDTDAKLAALHTEVADVKSRLDKDSLRALCLLESENPLERHISEAEKLLNKYELKLNEYGNASRVQTDFVPLSDVSLADEAWHSKMTEVMESQEKDIKKIQQLLGDAESMWKDLPRLSDLNKYTNQTLESVAALQRNLTEADEKSVAKVTAKLRDMGDRLLATNEDIQASLTQGNTMSERAYNDIQRSYDALRLEVQTFSKNLMQSIADETNATKKRIEYENHNLLMEITGITRVQGDLLNMTINERFDNTEAVIMASQAGSFKILSGKIESDMSQVWRQIGTMYQQLAATKTTLDKLTEQTAQYVNGSATALDGIKTKIGKVSSLTAEVQENVNYFMGKVSLLSQEFSHVKESLGAALDEATTNLRDAKTEIGKDNGPGPHVAKPAA